MFKKPLSDLKTIAPLRTSDRRKLKQRVLETYAHLQLEDGDILVPEGLHHQKFATYAGDPGVAYFSMEGDPLWFTIGKNSDASLIPTVYTLWKRPDLLPFLSTPAPVIPKLVNGADLMIPGVVQHSPGLREDQLVAVTQYHGDKLGYPIAVGRMAVNEQTLLEAEESDVKGKAVYMLHTWKDTLWEMGASKGQDVPEPRTIQPAPDPQTGQVEAGEHTEVIGEQPATHGTPMHLEDEPVRDDAVTSASSPPLTAEDVSHFLRDALLQALQTSLASLPASAFPISASTFWSSYVLPARPVHVPDRKETLDPSMMDAKHSTHKSVKAFLKVCAKDGLIKLKDAKGGDVVVTAVFPKHPEVSEHRQHLTLKDVELRQQKTEDRERKEREAEEKRKGEIQVTEFWKPLGTTLNFFIASEKDTSGLYTLSDLKTILNAYISGKNLVNAREQAYVNVSQDEALLAAVTSKNELGVEFLKREEVLARLRDHMQSWYEIRVEGKDVLRKKGQLKPIQVVMKVRQGRKACTLVTGFEPYFLDAEDLAEELRRICASSTSVTPIQGKASGMEVMVQGKQIKAVADLLVNKGVPKKWIESTDMTAEKKKK